MSEQVAAEQASTAPVSAQVGGRGVLLVPHRAPGVDKGALPPEYQRILAVVQQAAGPVMTRQVGEVLGLDTGGGAPWSRCAGNADQAGRPRPAAEAPLREDHRPAVSVTAVRRADVEFV
ncbi:hypothetical protein [Streptomyces mirabilis]|uniref:hypothetical protein n=1 Tax=Streptomyces mirabilis TaxID=68239 RepID=UPI0034128EE1